jgi:hypothetical protein
MRSRFSFLTYLLLSVAGNTAFAQASTTTQWKFQKDQDNKCIAKYALFKGVELTPQKLTITTKETSDLKTFEVLANDKIIAPMGRASLTDTSCKCIRIRNSEVLSAENIVIRVRGQSSSDVPVDATISIQQAATAMQALKSDICNKTQK